MQTLNCLVALGGELGMTVPKLGLTVAEARLLQFIHGDDAVHEVEPAGDIPVTKRDIRQDLAERYPAREEGKPPIALIVFPSLGDVPETFEELNLHEGLYKVAARVQPPSAPATADIFDEA